MADIDELSIKIEASAQKALPELDNLISKLTELQTSLNRISTKSFQTSLSKLSSINLGVSTAQSTSLTNLLKTLSTFSFKGVSKTFTNVSKDFSTVFGSIKTGASKAVTGFKNLVTNMTNTKKHSENLITSLGKLYAKILIFKNIGSFIKEGINSSINYVETYHYFETAIGKVAQGSKDLWAQYGAESAEAYADSFMKRSMALNEKMTGYTVDENGNAVANGMKNLGLNPDLLMQYQAEYAQMADSIGMGGEASLASSMALSMIAADWASLRNISFKEAYEKMASALAGQARAVRSLGIDITQNSLQQILDNLGIEATMMDLTQAEKSMLRVIAIIEQSEVAWGDLAETIETPANQIRLLQENIKSLARTIGNIFIPIVATVLPYLNAFSLSLRKGFEWIGTMLGIDVSKYVSSSSGASMDFSDIGLGDDMGDLLTDGVTGLDGEGEGEGGGLAPGVLDQALLDALNKYQTVWDSEFDNMQSKAQETSNKINEAASKIYRAFKDKDWETIGSYFSNGINGGLEAVYNFLKNNQFVSKLTGFVGDVAQSLNSIVDKVNFEKLGNDIGAGLNSAVSLALSWYGNFDFQNLGKKFSDVINGIFDEVNWEQLGRLIGSKFQSTWDVFAGLIPNLDGTLIGNSIASFLNGVIERVNFESIGQTFASGMNVAINVLKSFVSNFDSGNQLAISFTNGINRFINGVNWTESGKALGGFVDKLLSEFATGLNRIEWENLGNGISNGITKFINSVPWEKRAAELSMGFNRVIRGLATGIGNINAEGLGQKLSASIDRIFKMVKWEDLGKLVVTPFNKIREFISGFVSDENFFKDAGTSLAGFMNGIFEIDLTTAADNLATIFNGIFTAIEGFLDGTDDRAGFDWDKLKTNLTSSINRFIEKIDLAEAASKLNSAFSKVLNALSEVIKEIDWEQLGRDIAQFLSEVDWASHFLTVINLIKEVVTGLWKGLGESFAGKIVQGIILFKLANSLLPFVDKIALFFTGSPLVGVSLNTATQSMLSKAIKSGVSKVAEKIGEYLEPVTSGIKAVLTGADIAVLASASALAVGLAAFPEAAAKIQGFVEQAEGYNGIVSGMGSKWAETIRNLQDAGIITAEQSRNLLQIVNDCETAEKSVEETTGEVIEELKNYGVSYEQLSKNVSDYGKDTATQVGEAYDAIIGKGAELGEGFSNLATTFNLKGTSIGNDVDAMEALVRQSLSDIQGDVLVSNAVWEKLSEIVASSTGNSQESFEQFVTVLKEQFGWSDESIQKFMDKMSINFPEAVRTANSSIDTASQHFSPLRDRLKEIHENSGSIVSVFRNNFPGALNSTTQVSDNTSSRLRALNDSMTGLRDATDSATTKSGFFKSALEKLVFKDVIDGAQKATEKTTGLDSIIDSFSGASVWRIIKMALYGSTAETAGTKFETAGNKVEGMGTAFDVLNTTIASKGASFKATAKTTAENIPAGLAEGMNSETAMKRVSDATRNMFESGIMGTGKALMAIHSPSAVMRDQFGKPIDEGLADGISQYAYLVSNAVGNLKTAITRPLTDWSFMSTISSAVSNIPSAIVSGISSNSWVIANAMSAVMEQIKSPFYNIWSVMDGFGRQAANGFANGMRWTSIPLPHIGWNWNTITYGNGNWVQVPDFFLNWYARGGLFTTPTIAGFGEAGDEAALPLTNKGVMSRIADSIVSASDGFSGMSREDMIEAVATGVAMAMSQNPQVVEVVVNSVLKTNDEKLAQSVERGKAKLSSRYNPAIGYNY